MGGNMVVRVLVATTLRRGLGSVSPKLLRDPVANKMEGHPSTGGERVWLPFALPQVCLECPG